MLDHVHTGVHGAIDIERLAIARDAEAERVRLVHGGVDFLDREVAGDLDDVGAVVELLADRAPPVVGAIRDSHRAAKW